jgi:uncharacterized protein (TIGR02246 family)
MAIGPLLAGLLLAGCIVESQQFTDAARIHAIEGLRWQIGNAENTGNASVFGKIAADDVVVMPPNAQPIVGRDAAETAMREFFGKFWMQIEYTDSAIEIRGDSAIDRGRYSQTITPKGGGDAVESKGSYLWIYRRDESGEWRQTHAIWN